MAATKSTGVSLGTETSSAFENIKIEEHTGLKKATNSSANGSCSGNKGVNESGN